MKIFQASFDTVLMTILAEDLDDAKNQVKETSYGDDIYVDIGGLYIQWDEDYSEMIIIKEVPMERGIIQLEAH